MAMKSGNKARGMSGSKSNRPKTPENKKTVVINRVHDIAAERNPPQCPAENDWSFDEDELFSLPGY